ncbi:hypothetical protein [Nitrobacter sp.]|uniref:hypothetical protein n=1 Tax=Nitrobacter sp. TaxID=29420 RepID=UPI0029CAB2D3|nr:hypothetical protein [Nitrobacter sp.]
MHKFFADEPSSEPVAGRIYARPIEWIDGEYLLFDGVDADFFDRFREELGDRISIQVWHDYVERARVYAIEVDALNEAHAASRAWLKSHPPEDLPEWVELSLTPTPDGTGEADIFDNINGPPVNARFEMNAAAPEIAAALQKATDLTPYVQHPVDIESVMPSSTIDQVLVLDVGQGSGNALVSGGKVVAYADLGAGVLRNSITWPQAFTGLCVRHAPTVILSHWHYDHFHGANKFSSGGYHPAHGLSWIAPFQTLAPGVQSAMAKNIASNGRLMVWNGTGSLSRGSLTVERCTGPAKGMNRDGIAVWVRGPKGEDPILLQADAGYDDIPALKGGQNVTAFTVSHHGGKTVGTPPAPATAYRRIAFSFGHGNTHHHPRQSTFADLAAVGWTVGKYPGPAWDDPRTEDRRLKPGGPVQHGNGPNIGLGHISLDWGSGPGPALSCLCGCTLDPTQ